ncbi:hypothetical protein [Pleomorphovibrio marinus]|uniref:hypothetical protein n=1 Tax=Pleomorphovibrio marinus TaxID=2164132 RepID=UPI000E0BB471|nr:hypothetical protein [Pleomorphovibrio marinus]
MGQIIAISVILFTVFSIGLLFRHLSNCKEYGEVWIDLRMLSTLDQKLRKVINDIDDIDDEKVKIVNIVIYGDSRTSKDVSNIESKDLVGAKMVKVEFCYE